MKTPNCNGEPAVFFVLRVAADGRFGVPPPLRVSGPGMTTSTGFVIPAARSAIRNRFRFGVFDPYVDVPVFFRPPPGRTGNFSLHGQREVTKRKATRRCVFRPSMDEKSVRPGRACRRAIHGAAHPAGLIVGPHRSTGVQKKLCFDSGHRGLAGNEAKQFASSSHAHRMCVQWGPSNTAGGRRISPKDGPQDAGQFAAGTWMCRWRTPAAARAS
jgi:hypothetical protein